MLDRARFRLTGRVVDRASREAGNGLRIEALDRSAACERPVTSVTTDADGRFTLELGRAHFDELFANRRPVLVFKLFRRDALVDTIETRSQWGVEDTETEILIETDLADGGESLARPRRRGRTVHDVCLAGRVIEAVSGYPMSGVIVRVFDCQRNDPASDAAPAERPAIGQAITDSNGRFEILSRAEGQRAQERYGHGQRQGCCFELHVATHRDPRPLFVSQPMARRQVRRVPLAVVLPPTPVTAMTWAAIAGRLEENRVIQVNELAHQLVHISPAQSIFADLDLGTRHHAMAALEQAFLDPRGILSRIAPVPTFHQLKASGAWKEYRRVLGSALEEVVVQTAFAEAARKVGSFRDVFHVDWPIDLTKLKDGDPGTAVAKFQDSYDSDLTVKTDPVFHTQQPSDSSRYRDYLRTIFTGATNSPDYVTYHEQLATRFQQNFQTLNTTDAPANDIVIPIVEKILTAPENENGFAIAPTTIDPQGQRTAREYLDYLISLTTLSAHEVGLRYRLNLDRPDSAISTRVQENIFTLQRFYSDSFQTAEEPHPIIPTGVLGRAPFFLQFDEWLQLQGPFYGENFLPIRATFRIGLTPEQREQLKGVTFPDSPNLWWGEQVFQKWFVTVVAVDEALSAGHAKFDLQQYQSAREHYLEAADLAIQALSMSPEDAPNSPAFVEDAHQAWEVTSELEPMLAEAKGLPITNEEELHQFTDFFAIATDTIAPSALHEEHEQHRVALLHAYVYLIQICLGDVAMELGEYATATQLYARTTGFLVGQAKMSSGGGYPDYFKPLESVYVHEFADAGGLYEAGNLPYTADLAAATFPTTLSEFRDALLQNLVPERTNPMELAFCTLRQGNALLEWADSLYRADSAASLARARELYKAVLWLHGEAPPIGPHWNHRAAGVFLNHHENPALTSQKARARQGLVQIEAGLNYYGSTDSHVPALRYRPLKDAADRFAAAAHATQQDFLTSLGKVEDAVRESIVNANMLKKARLQSQMADEQVKIAQAAAGVAAQQVQQVHAAIDAKKKEIEDHDSLGQQFVDWVGAAKDTVTALPDWSTEGIKEGAGEELGIKKMKTEGGLFEKGGWLGLGSSGASLGAGFGVFVYVGIKSLVTIGDAQNQRAADLATLRDSALPLANLQLEVRQREVTIAKLQQQIANADAQLATELMQFQATRTLDIEFWGTVAAVMKRVMRRYLELAARCGWVAERALAYEQDRTINIIRFDYFPMKLAGVTGADLLQLDLAELDAGRLATAKQTLPIKHTYSLAFDFPVQFAQLKKTGRCTFHSMEQPLRLAYPGTYDYRILAVTAAVQSLSPVGSERGLLTNSGISLLSRQDGSTHLAVRREEAFPLSEFRLRTDMEVYGLPGDLLMNFEGSGVETFWTLEFPAIANPYGLESLADILVTLDVTARFSSELYSQHVSQPPKAVRRMVLMSALKHQPESLEALVGNGSVVTIPFGMRGVATSTHEINRTVTNAFVFASGHGSLDFAATLSVSSPPIAVSFAFENGMAVSNAPPFSDDLSTAAPSPLNALAGVAMDQVFSLTIDKTHQPAGAFDTIGDVVLGLEYTAEFVS